MAEPDFIAFSDESSVGGRYRSIAICSLPFTHYRTFTDELQTILDQCCLTEFKWQKVRNAKYRFAALKLLDSVFAHVSRSGLRVDVLMWDIKDARHAIRGRDDTANFGRMLFHGFRHALTLRDRNASWEIYPDERLDIDWDTVNSCLAAVGRWREHVSSDFGEFFGDQYYRITRFSPCVSHEHPLCQVADLFAGIFVFSIERFEEYRRWRSQSGVNHELFPDSTKLSCSDAERSVVLEHLAYSPYAVGCLRAARARSPGADPRSRSRRSAARTRG